MEDLKISCKGYSNEHATFYIADYCAEYPLPEFDGVSIRLHYDGFEIARALEILDQEQELKNNADSCLKVVKNRIVKRIQEEEFDDKYLINFPDVDSYAQWDEGHTHIWHLTIWRDAETDTASRVEQYYQVFKSYVTGAVQQAGGDDDFFDYMPNYVDMFMQFAEMLGKQDDFNEWAEEINKTDKHIIDLDNALPIFEK